VADAGLLRDVLNYQGTQSVVRPQGADFWGRSAEEIETKFNAIGGRSTPATGPPIRPFGLSRASQARFVLLGNVVERVIGLGVLQAFAVLAFDARGREFMDEEFAKAIYF
jgi:hypothetical protein